MPRLVEEEGPDRKVASEVYEGCLIRVIAQRSIAEPDRFEAQAFFNWKGQDELPMPFQGGISTPPIDWAIEAAFALARQRIDEPFQARTRTWSRLACGYSPF